MNAVLKNGRFCPLFYERFKAHFTVNLDLLERIKVSKYGKGSAEFLWQKVNLLLVAATLLKVNVRKIYISTYIQPYVLLED